MGYATGWHDYDMDVSCEIEEAYMKNQQSLDLSQTPSNMPYTINFVTNIQTRNETGMSRRIQRLKTADAYMTDLDGQSVPHSHLHNTRHAVKKRATAAAAGTNAHAPSKTGRSVAHGQKTNNSYQHLNSSSRGPGFHPQPSAPPAPANPAFNMVPTGAYNPVPNAALFGLSATNIVGGTKHSR